MEIIKKIAAIMSEIGAIEKNRRNPQQGYSFRGIDDIYNALQPLLAKHGVVIIPNVIEQHREEREGRNGGALIYSILKVEFSFIATDGSSIKAVTIGEAMDSGDKSCNKAMSAAMKYACLEVFCIPTEEEKDTEYQTHEVKPKVSQAKEDNKTPQDNYSLEIQEFEVLSHTTREANGRVRHGFKLKDKSGNEIMAGTSEEGIANRMRAALANGGIVSVKIKDMGKIKEIVEVSL